MFEPKGRTKILSVRCPAWIVNRIEDMRDKEHEPNTTSEIARKILFKGFSAYDYTLEEPAKKLVENTDKYDEKDVKKTLIARENQSAKVFEKSITFRNYIDKKLCALFLKLNDYDTPEDVEAQLREYLKQYKDRAEVFGHQSELEARINNPLKYVFERFDRIKRYNLLKYLDNEHDVQEYVNVQDKFHKRADGLKVEHKGDNDG